MLRLYKEVNVVIRRSKDHKWDHNFKCRKAIPEMRTLEIIKQMNDFAPILLF